MSKDLPREVAEREYMLECEDNSSHSPNRLWSTTRYGRRCAREALLAAANMMVREMHTPTMCAPATVDEALLRWSQRLRALAGESDE